MGADNSHKNIDSEIEPQIDTGGMDEFTRRLSEQDAKDAWRR